MLRERLADASDISVYEGFGLSNMDWRVSAL